MSGPDREDPRSAGDRRGDHEAYGSRGGAAGGRSGPPEEPRRGRQYGRAAHSASGRSSAPVGRSSLWVDDDTAGPQPLRASWDPVREALEAPRPVRVRQTARRRHKRTAVGWFVHHYGWRAYAIPVLIALTVVVVIQIGREGRAQASPSASDPTLTTVAAAPTSTVVVTATDTAVAAPNAGDAGATGGSTGPDPNGTFGAATTFGSLPPGAAFTAQGAGTWHIVPGTTAPFGGGATTMTYTVEVEDGIESTADDQEFAAKVDAALQDTRSWIASGQYTFQRIDSGDPTFRVSLTSQLTVRQDSLCGWQIQLEASCYARDAKRVAINNARWARGAVSYNGDLGLYRSYAINHEVGHALGFVHQPCPVNGGLAPVMMQQSWSVANDDLAQLNPELIPPNGYVCQPNPYPYPRGPGSGVSATDPNQTSTPSGG